MSTTGYATLLGLTSLYPRVQALEFSVPFDNGIRVIGWDDIILHESIYYGDEIDLHFWSLLKLPFGISNDPENPLTLQEGYLYKYNHKLRTFDVYDDGGIRIIHKTNIHNIAQMNIDFTIANSHQFEILTDGALDGYVFMFPAICRKKVYPSDINNIVECGVQNIYLPDRVRPYLPTDLDNPSWYIQHLATYDESQKWVNTILSVNYSAFYVPISGLDKYNGIDWNKNCPTNYFYMKELYEIARTNLPDNIANVPIFDPTECYDVGDFIRGNTQETEYTLYMILSSSCQLKTIIGYDEHGNPIYDCNVDPSSFVYVVKDMRYVFDLEIGKRYFVNNIIRVLGTDGNYVYYLVKTEFVLTDWEVDIVNTQKICTLLEEIKKFKRFTFFKEYINFLYMQLGIGLYPALMPIQRYDETQNNRPVYEPWLIWGFYKFLWNKKTTDWDDDIDIPLFDLSPLWG